MIKNLFTKLSIFDSILGGFLCVLLSIIFPIATGVFAAESASFNRPAPVVWLLWFVFGITSVAELWLVFSVWGAIFRKQYPIALSVAWQQPTLPKWLRPFAGIYWLGHSVLGAVWSSLFHSFAENNTFLPMIGTTFLAFGFSFVAYLYVVIAAMSFRKSPDLLRWVWRARLSYSLLIALVGFVTGRFIK